MTEPIHLDTPTVLKVLEECVRDRGPDYVYRAVHNVCLYWHGDEDAPGCIVGLALYKLGVSADELRTHNSIDAAAILSQLRESGTVTYTGEALHLLLSVQSDQDIGIPWGTALADAYHYLELEHA